MALMRNSVTPAGYRNVPEHHAAIIGTIFIGNAVVSIIMGTIDLAYYLRFITNFDVYNYMAAAVPIWSGAVVSIRHI